MPLLQDVSDDLSAVESRWLSSNKSAATPDGGDMDGYSRNLQHMNDSLQDLQSDIQRLAQQQSQIQQMMNHSSSSQGQMHHPHSRKASSVPPFLLRNVPD